MIGKRSKQRDLFDVGWVCELGLDPQSFHGQLAAAAPGLFSDQDFEALYHGRLGRPSVPPSQLALLMLLQHEGGVSDERAIGNSAYDARWAMILGTRLGEPLCAKSTLQLFRTHLVVAERARTILKKSLAEARRKGLLKQGPLRVAVDTLPIAGAGAVKDTYNLLAAGIWRVIVAVAKAEGEERRSWAARHDLERYVPERHRSLKGEAEIDWSDLKARQEVLQEIVEDALEACKLARAAAERVEGKAREAIREAEGLLGQLVLQDVEVRRGEHGKGRLELKEGTEPGRIPSATDPDQRHGHKSQSNRFTGHKARTVVDTESQIILDAEILPGNAGDAAGLGEQIQEVQQRLEEPVAAVLGDCAMGNGATRAEFEELGIALYAKVPAEGSNRGLFPKSRFLIDLEANTVTCPAGECAHEFTLTGDAWKIFRFGSRCAECPLRGQCTESASGRTVRVHPQEVLLRAARELMATPEGRRLLRRRMAAEHRQARLAQLRVKQARYCGHAKVLVQFLLAATIANLRLIWNWEARQQRVGGDYCASGMGAGANNGGSPAALAAAGRSTGSIWGLLVACGRCWAPGWRFLRFSPRCRAVQVLAG